MEEGDLIKLDVKDNPTVSTDIKETIFLVGTKSPEHTSVYVVCDDKKEAMMVWHRIRGKLIERNMERIDSDGFPNEMYERMVENLKETNPNKMSNYPHTEPFISERKVVGDIKDVSFDEMFVI